MMPAQRRARLFKNGRNQALRIPREFEFPGNEVIVRKEGDCLIIEPLAKASLASLLSRWSPLNETFPDVDADSLALDDIVL